MFVSFVFINVSENVLYPLLPAFSMLRDLKSTTFNFEPKRFSTYQQKTKERDPSKPLETTIAKNYSLYEPCCTPTQCLR